MENFNQIENYLSSNINDKENEIYSILNNIFEDKTKTGLELLSLDKVVYTKIGLLNIPLVLQFDAMNNYNFVKVFYYLLMLIDARSLNYQILDNHENNSRTVYYDFKLSFKEDLKIIIIENYLENLYICIKYVFDSNNKIYYFTLLNDKKTNFISLNSTILKHRILDNEKLKLIVKTKGHKQIKEKLNNKNEEGDENRNLNKNESETSVNTSDNMRKNEEEIYIPNELIELFNPKKQKSNKSKIEQSFHLYLVKKIREKKMKKKIQKQRRINHKESLILYEYKNTQDSLFDEKNEILNRSGCLSRSNENYLEDFYKQLEKPQITEA